MTFSEEKKPDPQRRVEFQKLKLSYTPRADVSREPFTQKIEETRGKVNRLVE